MTPLLLKARDTLDTETGVTYSFNRTQRNFTEVHTHDFYEISLVTAGRICHHVNGQSVEHGANTLIFIRPSDVHRMVGACDDEFEYVNIAFPSDLLDHLAAYLGCEVFLHDFSAAPMPPSFRISGSETTVFRAALEQLSLLPPADPGRIRLCARRLIGDLVACCCVHVGEAAVSQQRWFTRLLEELNRPEHFSVGIPWLIERSGKSPSYISRMFRASFNTTPTDYINSLRLNYCANRLIHSDIPIIDIAMDAGFCNLSHFYHLFKQVYGTSPSRYRSENRILL